MTSSPKSREEPLLVRPVIVGTAGHIDHGKTTLIQALTGIDCDRWEEEKRRGITIDLGFAHLEAGDLQVGFIDVPGHERFVHNALAGLGGIRVVLLVVAADEGVKPQTIEHLEICSLLSIPSCVVALSKSDLVDEEILEMARLEIAELLNATHFAGSSIVPVSSTTGDGLDALRAALLEQAADHAVVPDPERPTRFPIDRGFHLKGLGVVSTGTLISGSVGVGDTLICLPTRKSARVRSLQVHGEDRQRAVAGERTAMQLAGVALDDIRRGYQLVSNRDFVTTTRLVGNCRLLPGAPRAMKGWTTVRFHLLSSEVGAKVRPLSGPLTPGSRGYLEIRLAEPVVAIRGDRYIIRRPSPASTLGGGVVLDPVWRHRRTSDVEPALSLLDGEQSEAVQLWVDEAREHGVATESIAHRLGKLPDAAERALRTLVSEQRALRMPAGRGHTERWIAPAVVRRLAQRATRILSEYFRHERLAEGIPKAEAIDRILPPGARTLSEGYLEWLQAQGVLTVRGDVIDLPGRSAQLSHEESELSRRIVESFESAGLQPPPPTEIRSALGAKPQIFDGIVQYLLQTGDLLRLPGGLLISAKALRGLERDLLEASLNDFKVGEFKSRYGLTRKWAIPILEHLDSKGVTRRVGDLRQLVGRSQ
ncbi:MAG: selenocysteine-specific translation elongation factor [Acidobacteriota bacterium]